MTRVELIEAALIAALEKRADYMVQRMDWEAEPDAVPVPHIYGIDTSDLNLLEVAQEIDAALDSLSTSAEAERHTEPKHSSG